MFFCWIITRYCPCYRTTAPTLEELRASLKHLAKVELGSDEMRAEFPLAFDAFTYCNNGSFGVAPSAVMTYREQLLRYVESNPDMWCFQESFKRIRGAIDILCAAEGLPADDTVFVMNATAGINVAVNALISKLTSSKGKLVSTRNILFHYSLRHITSHPLTPSPCCLFHSPLFCRRLRDSDV